MPAMAEKMPAEEDRWKVVAYVRVSTSDQADSGAGLEAQRAAITLEAARRGWELVHIYEDAGASAQHEARIDIRERNAARARDRPRDRRDPGQAYRHGVDELRDLDRRKR